MSGVRDVAPLPLDLPARALTLRLSLAVAAVGLTVLAGWLFGLPLLTGLSGEITMKANASIALLLCAFALWSIGRLPPVVTMTCGAAAALIGGVTLLEHLTGWDLGIDQALFTEAAGAAATASPNRMGPNAALSLLLAGTSLALLARGTHRAITAAQRLACAGLILALLALAGYIYGATQLYAIARYTGIALHTALTLFLLHIGILAVRSDTGPMSRFVSDGPEGTLLRRLALPITALPLALGYGILVGRAANLYDRGLALSLFASALILVLWFTVWKTARALEQSDVQRREAERARDELLARERRARDDAERANQLKDHFIATLSHELRTPLNVMLGWTRVLESDAHPEAHARAAMVVARNGRLLARLVEDLLDISRATAGHFELTRTTVPINAVVQVTCDGMTPVAADKGVTLFNVADPDAGAVEADQDRLQQVIWNLLSNAVKFTPAGGRVTIQTARRESHVTVIVNDTGVGFDAEFAPHIFEPFRQADPSTKREHGGLGLGLSIARHLVELHGGTLTAASDGVGRGATFTLTLPAAPGAVDGVGTASPPVAAAEPQRA